VRTIGVVTVARSDYGIYLPLLRKIQTDPDLRLHLIVAGMHLSPEFGLTVAVIEGDGFEIGERVEMLLSSDTPEGIAKSIGLGTIGFAQAYARFQPDILVVLGDRFEMYAAALAALPFKIPLGHIHGGEVTQGAIDDALRHSITKLSHLHFVSAQEYAQRVEQLGEEPWRVVVSGAPSLDNLHSIDLLTPEELETRYGLLLRPPPLLVTFHSVTLEYEQTEWQVSELLAALDASGMPVIFTMPNADTNGRIIQSLIADYSQMHSSAYIVDNLGTCGYFSLMTVCAAVVGNSSSGIIEAPSFGLPVVNIGTRQRGRVRAANVIDVGYSRLEILEGIRTTVQTQFRESLQGLVNPYGSGQASDQIVERLKNIHLDERLASKRFYDISRESS
jgi:UDP-hydrolysing UDP-N-acetyl-D-glucosamine 2-epimerase|tara:strand:+ start:5795 stop:6961 length:1167 start_codon:yes stop_codon:yes gene_type:complete